MAIILCISVSVNAQNTQKSDTIPPANEDSSARFNNKNSIAGTWYVNATPDGPPPFKGLITFTEGGGMIASAQGDNLPAFNSLATPGHGAWTRTANREYLFTFVQLLYDGEGSYEGEIRIRHTATMNNAGTQWSGNLTLEVFSPDGDLVFVGTGSASATRIVPLPLL